MSRSFNETMVENAALTWLADAGWYCAYGPTLAPDGESREREDWCDVVLVERLRRALARNNPDLPSETIEHALRKLLVPEGAELVTRNQAAHRMLLDGVTVEYRNEAGEIRGTQVKVIDFERPGNNDFLALNQFKIIENRNNRRPDVVLFVNGLPLAVFELKNAAAENATLRNAHAQLETYKAQVPSLFTHNAVLVLSDGVEALIGTLTAGAEWFKPWHTVSGEVKAAAQEPQLQVMIEGVFAPERFLQLVRDFIVFEDDGGRIAKKMAGYHQFHAVRAAVAETLRAAELVQAREAAVAYQPRDAEAAARPGGVLGDRRVGVIWHTQGSGKSLTMAFYAGCVIREPAMRNPTLVVLTDRNDLDDQLFATFSRCKDLLRQPPVQAASRTDLREKLKVKSGGVVFTTIHKFFPDEKGDPHPLLSDRRNIVVIADEAHRSQYDFLDGFARHMRDALPGASFIGFTGTPIEQTDANTRAVFGDYISVYDIQRAVQDGATVPIYYESRLAKLQLDEAERPKIDPDFEEVTEGEEIERREKLKSKWAQLEAIVGTPRRLKLLAEDIVEHYERRSEAMHGKAMIVCMSRRICVELYQELVRLRPDWQGEEDGQGALKVIMTGAASDPAEWQGHIRNKPRREQLAKRFRDPKDPFGVVIVRDMWLTGFDAPSLATMYVDKPMRGHGLMQAIARVNRVFRDKPGGLVVDYIGLAQELKDALATYTESGGTGDTALNKELAVTVMLEKYEVCRGLFHGFDYSRFGKGSPTEQVSLLPAAQEHILAQENGKQRFLQAVMELSKAFALAVPHKETERVRDDLIFFQAVKAVLSKRLPGDARTEEELEHAVRQILSRAVTPQGVVDIFQAAGLKRPDISILSDEFLEEIRGMQHRNLAIELLQKLLLNELRTRQKQNLVQGRSFAEMLERAIRRYQNRAIETAQVIDELIHIAGDMKAASDRGKAKGLSDEELAFYDALETSDSAVAVMGDEKLVPIAQELVRMVRANVTIDWTVRENVRANLRRLVKRILNKYGYPPDKREKAVATVLEQAELLCEDWASGT